MNITEDTFNDLLNGEPSRCIATYILAKLGDTYADFTDCRFGVKLSHTVIVPYRVRRLPTDFWHVATPWEEKVYRSISQHTCIPVESQKSGFLDMRAPTTEEVNTLDFIDEDSIIFFVNENRRKVVAHWCVLVATELLHAVAENPPKYAKEYYRYSVHLGGFTFTASFLDGNWKQTANHVTSSDLFADRANWRWDTENGFLLLLASTARLLNQIDPLRETEK